AFDTPQQLEAMRARMKTKENPAPQYDHRSRMLMTNSLTMTSGEVEQRIKAGQPYVIRAKMPAEGDVQFKDLIRGEVAFLASLLDDKVLFKSDGMPTYHLANVVDDYLMKITHVIRGEEWLSSTPLHVLLYKFFGWEKQMPQFAHLPLILRPDGNGKLSKRDGDRLGFPVFPLTWRDTETGEVSKGFRERGFLPEAFVNLLAMLGWNPGTEQEIFSKAELVEAFSLERIVKSGARFDFEKAKWFNQQFLRKKSGAELVEIVKPVLLAHGVEKEDAFIEKSCRLLLERVTFAEDFWEQGKYLFTRPDAYDEKILKKRWKPDSAEIFEKLMGELNRLTDFSSQAIDKAVHDFAAAYRYPLSDVLPAFRIMLTGVSQGPSVFEIAALLGKEEVTARMKTGMERFGKVLANG
ncbi:MAG TPA: glutamate--tRNA ligase, partial [Chitinophagales bacterium]|nr:glutamate--tRNA ligase [Chitinophagales bacterium]